MRASLRVMRAAAVVAAMLLPLAVQADAPAAKGTGVAASAGAAKGPGIASGAGSAKGAASGGAASDKDKAIIDYRQHIMKTLNEQSGALGQILSTVVPDTNTQAHLQAIALAASLALKAFEPKVQGGEAKPEVWSDWPDFSKRMSEFAQKTAEMAKTAKEQGNEAALAMVVDALSCKSCHDTYRNEKEKKK
jgi:cytochrome c556